jgi:hypothetical protein
MKIRKLLQEIFKILFLPIKPLFLKIVQSIVEIGEILYKKETETKVLMLLKIIHNKKYLNIKHPNNNKVL